MNGKPKLNLCCLLLATLVLELITRPLPAQPNSGTPPPSRYLIILDTSYAMRRRAPAVQKAVENLMRSSMSVQLRPGDTIGVWTYDEQLYAGVFPLQLWTPQRSEMVASNVVAFVKSQNYQKRASNFEAVVPALIRVAHDSYRLTVLVVSDGNETFPGLPFDTQIQQLHAEAYKKQEKAKMPFITVLRCFRGEFQTAAVSLAPWPVEFPPFPPEPPVVRPQITKPAEPKPTPRPEAPPLIVSGRKPEPTAVTNTPAERDAAVAIPPPAGVEPTNSPPGAKVEPASSSASPTAPTNPPVNPPAQVPVAGAETPVTPPSRSNPTPTIPTTRATTTAPVPVSEPSAPPPTVAKPSTSAVETVAAPPVPATNEVQNPSTPPVPIPPVAAAKTPQQLPVAPPATNSSGQETATAATAPPPAAAGSTQSEAVESAPNTNPPAGVSLGIQPEPGFGRLGLLAIGVATLLLAIALSLVIRHRARQAAGASLITHSMGRDKE